MTVCSGSQERRVIRADEDPVVPLLFQPCVQGLDDMAINLFDCLHLGGHIAFMRRFVGGFHMHDDQVDIVSFSVSIAARPFAA